MSGTSAYPDLVLGKRNGQVVAGGLLLLSLMILASSGRRPRQASRTDRPGIGGAEARRLAFG